MGTCVSARLNTADKCAYLVRSAHTLCPRVLPFIHTYLSAMFKQQPRGKIFAIHGLAFKCKIMLQESHLFIKIRAGVPGKGRVPGHSIEFLRTNKLSITVLGTKMRMFT